jgi:hypothetical protein
MKNWYRLDVRPEFSLGNAVRYEDLDYKNGKLFAVNQARFFQVLHESYGHFEIVRLDEMIGDPLSKPRCLSMAEDGKTGFIGVLGNKTPATNRILRTRDGGRNWEDVSPPASVGPLQGICGIHTNDGKMIWAAGSYHNGAQNSGVIMSSDGGESWTQTLHCQSAVDIWVDHNGDGIVVGRDEDWPSIWICSNGSLKWTQHLLMDNLNLVNGTGWKIFNYRGAEMLVSIAADKENGQSSFYTSTLLRSSWSGLSVMTPNAKLHGIARNDTTHWLGRKGTAMLQSIDQKNWLLAKDAAGDDMNDINRIIYTEDGYYAAGEHLYELR